MTQNNLQMICTIVRGLSVEAIECLESSLKSHIPTEDAPWISYRRLTALFRTLNSKTQVAILKRHYAGIAPLDTTAVNQGVHVGQVASFVLVNLHNFIFTNNYHFFYIIDALANLAEGGRFESRFRSRPCELQGSSQQDTYIRVVLPFFFLQFHRTECRYGCS